MGPEFEVARQNGQDWWNAVQSVAILMIREGIRLRDEGIILQELEEEGYSQPAIQKAIQWIENVNLTGNLQEVVAMVAPEQESPRMLHPVESAMLPGTFLKHIEASRKMGILTPEISEKLVEGLRYLDTRDWETADFESFVVEVLESSSNHSAVEQYKAFCEGRLMERFH